MVGESDGVLRYVDLRLSSVPYLSLSIATVRGGNLVMPEWVIEPDYLEYAFRSKFYERSARFGHFVAQDVIRDSFTQEDVQSLVTSPIIVFPPSYGATSEFSAPLPKKAWLPERPRRRSGCPHRWSRSTARCVVHRHSAGRDPERLDVAEIFRDPFPDIRVLLHSA